MSPDVPDARKSFMEKARHLMDDGRWLGLQLSMDAVILTSKGDDPSTKKVLMTAHRMRGHALGRMSRFEEALTDLQEALELSKSLGDKHSEAQTLETSGMSAGTWATTIWRWTFSNPPWSCQRR